MAAAKLPADAAVTIAAAKPAAAARTAAATADVLLLLPLSQWKWKLQLPKLLRFHQHLLLTQQLALHNLARSSVPASFAKHNTLSGIVLRDVPYKI